MHSLQYHSAFHLHKPTSIRLHKYYVITEKHKFHVLDLTWLYIIGESEVDGFQWGMLIFRNKKKILKQNLTSQSHKMKIMETAKQVRVGKRNPEKYR